jgi:competence protein ComGC
MPDRAKYELIDAETGKTWETGGRVYGTVNQLKASAEDTIKPQGGRQSSQFESVNEESNKFADYSNNELLGYVKELYKQRSDAASKGQNALVNGLHKDIEAANRELKKRTQKLKDLTRTDESVNETQQYKKGDKLKIKLKNGKEFDVTFDSYGRQKGIAFGKFKDRSGEYDTKPFNLDTIVESVNEELNLSNYGTVTPPKGGASLVGKYNSIQGKSKYDTIIFDYQEGSDKPYGIVQVEGHGIYGSDLLKRLGLRQTRSWTAGVDVYIHDGNYTPVYVSEDDFKALLNFWSGGLDREAKAQADFYRNRGNTSGTIDEATDEDKKLTYNDFVQMVRDDMMAGSSPDEKPSDEQVRKKAKAYYNDYLQGASVDDLFEATEEDKIDIVTMDVPLFIRILEYSREDAQTDMDLHDLAEKAIAATKQQGILSMDDYNMLIGDSESLNEQSLDDQAKAYFLAKVKQGEIDTLPEDPKAAFLAQMMKDQMGHDKETLRRERGLEERISKALNELNEELCAKGKRYIKARKRAGEKSSAYLSGRAVKVCKGQIDWPKKGKKKVNESEIDALAKELANAVEDKLEDKKDEINEALDPISILSYVLAGNTLVNIIAKYIGKLFKKYNFGKGEEAAKKIYDFTHKLEQDFKRPIGRVVGLFTKDEKTKNTVTDGLFALLLLGLGAKAGTEAFSAIRKSNFIAGGVSGIKAALKGKDITTLVQDIVSNV